MKRAKLLLFLLLTLALTLVIAQNATPVSMRFLWLQGEVPAVLLLFLTALSGFVLGLLVALFTRGWKRRRS